MTIQRLVNNFWIHCKIFLLNEKGRSLGLIFQINISWFSNRWFHLFFFCCLVAIFILFVVMFVVTFFFFVFCFFFLVIFFSLIFFLLLFCFDFFLLFIWRRIILLLISRSISGSSSSWSSLLLLLMFVFILSRFFSNRIANNTVYLTLITSTHQSSFSRINSNFLFIWQIEMGFKYFYLM